MPSLSSMRSIEPGGDTFQPLGPPVREVREVPPPAPKPTGTPGVLQQPDGKLATNLPLPGVKPTAKLVFHAAPSHVDVLTEASFAGAAPLEPSPGPAWFVQEPPVDPVRAAFHTAVAIASKRANYPIDGRVWVPHNPEVDGQPINAGWVVLRNGQLRHARAVCWGKGVHSPNYDVVGWK